jgi:sterol desaturase/sphingolipid hydroxylase (fatty acid hydroxylase superfamily)
MLSIFAGCAAVFLVAERLAPARPQPVLRRGFFLDCAYCAMSLAARTLVNGTLAIALSDAGARLLPGAAIGVLRGRPVWVQAAAIVVALDLVFYVLHRLKHDRRLLWLWRLHETHHASEDLDWFSSVRFHPVEKLLDRGIYLGPLLFLGVSDEALLVLAATDAAISTFSHANLDWRIGPLIYVFNGPEMHRWHHAKDPARQSCNFGNNLSVFDWLFGTAYLSRERPRDFGLRDPSYPRESLAGQLARPFRPAAPRPAPEPSAAPVP